MDPALFIVDTPSHSSNKLVGSVRRFGEHGVLYEVLAPKDENLLKIRVLETGEEAFYPLEKALNDPSD